MSSVNIRKGNHLEIRIKIGKVFTSQKYRLHTNCEVTLFSHQKLDAGYR